MRLASDGLSTVHRTREGIASPINDEVARPASPADVDLDVGSSRKGERVPLWRAGEPRGLCPVMLAPRISPTKLSIISFAVLITAAAIRMQIHPDMQDARCTEPISMF